jgi:hypothetical protein
MSTQIVAETDPFFTRTRHARASGLTAAGAPVTPPDEWFADPALDKPTPLVVTSDGRVYGHLAAWNTRHIGMPGTVVPPRSRANYGYYRTGVVTAASGAEVPVGQLTLAGGHASLRSSAAQAAKHYDDTGSAVADLAAGEDQHGIWLAGALRPGVTDTQIRALRASAPSGDWRPIGGTLELVAACMVNTPGFPIARALTASADDGGEVLALVAAGASDMWFRRYRPLDADIAVRLAAAEEAIEALTASANAAARDALRARVAPVA